MLKGPCQLDKAPVPQRVLQGQKSHQTNGRNGLRQSVASQNTVCSLSNPSVVCITHELHRCVNNVRLQTPKHAPVGKLESGTSALVFRLRRRPTHAAIAVKGRCAAPSLPAGRKKT